MPQSFENVFQPRETDDAPTGGENETAERPEYSHETMDDIVSQEAFDASPQWMQERFSRFARKNTELRETNADLRARMAAIEARFEQQQAQLSQPVKKEPEGWERFTDAQLAQWERDAMNTLTRAAREPDNQELRDQVATIKAEHLDAVREERTRRMIEGRVGGLREEITGREQLRDRITSLQRNLANEFGNDVLDMDSSLMKRAAAKFADVARKLGTNDDSNGAISYIAIQEAHRELAGNNRDGRVLSDGDRRRLAVEGQVRREAGHDHTIATLRRRGQAGDHRAALQASNIEIDRFLDGMGISN